MYSCEIRLRYCFKRHFPVINFFLLLFRFRRLFSPWHSMSRSIIEVVKIFLYNRNLHMTNRLQHRVRCSTAYWSYRRRGSPLSEILIDLSMELVYISIVLGIHKRISNYLLASRRFREVLCYLLPYVWLSSRTKGNI